MKIAAVIVSLILFFLSAVCCVGGYVNAAAHDIDGWDSAKSERRNTVYNSLAISFAAVAVILLLFAVIAL